MSLGGVMSATDDKLRAGVPAGAKVWATGFEALDQHLTGGIRSGELVLLGGPQGLGKTTMALQIARHVAATGGVAVYFSFEHEAQLLLERLLGMELGETSGVDAPSLNKVRKLLQEPDGGTLEVRMDEIMGGRQAIEAMQEYADRLHLHSSSGSQTSMKVIREVIDQIRSESGQTPFVVIDYLQKVHVPLSPAGEDERITEIVEEMKDLALDWDIPMLSIVAAERSSGTTARRMRIDHLRGASALAYEADIVFIINDKYDVVARHHLVYDLTNAERFRAWVVISIEKNRRGKDKIDLEFRKRFEHGRFDREGNAVVEQLVDERIFID
jgi:replicative DNA helicase